MGEDNSDLKYGFYFLLGGLFAALVISRQLAIGLFIVAGIYYAFSGFYSLLAESKVELIEDAIRQRKRREPDEQTGRIQSTTSAPITDEPTIADRIKEIHRKNDFKCPSCGATVLPTYIKCKHCGSVLVDAVNLPKPERWGEVEIGQPIQVKHPKKGEMNLAVQNRTYYGELWQAQMKPDVPWTLTGSYYVGLGLSENVFLMNWQNRFYLLDLHQPLTDMSINRDFAPSARKFAASNQTAYVSFSYQEKVWHMEDIGRFRIEFAEGDGIRVSPGAVGRFIHASYNNEILIVEDYQTGGSGLDTLWMGYRIEEETIKL